MKVHHISLHKMCPQLSEVRRFHIFLSILTICTTNPLVDAIHDKYIDVPSYEGYKLFRFHPSSANASKLIFSTFEDNERTEIWSMRRNEIDVMVTKESVETLQKVSSLSHTPYTILIDDIERLISAQKRKANLYPNPESTHNMTWDKYYSNTEIMSYMDNIADTYDFAETEVIGNSYEGREIKI